MTMSEATSYSAKRSKNHILIFPFMAKGHTIPLLHLSSTLSLRGLKVTILTTTASSPFIHTYLNLPNPNINLINLPFPTTPTIPQGCESTDDLPTFDLFIPFLHATELFATPFRNVLRNMSLSGDLPLVVISDFFLFWTRPITEDEFGIPRLVFHGMGVFSMAVIKAYLFNPPSTDGHHTFHLPGTPHRLRLRSLDLPSNVRCLDPENPMVAFSYKAGVEDHQSWGILVNSFARMESDYVALLESSYSKGARAWLVGPLSIYPCGPQDKPNHHVMTWLDGKKTPGSVVYVSFGTQAEVPAEQLDEVAHGLMMSGWDFVWAVRSRMWAPPVEMLTWLEGEGKGKGVVCRELVPQREVLGHVAVGGFVSHCGWNSVMESVSNGVPILAWPVIDVSEQGLNAKYVVDEMDVGVRIDDVESGVVGREKVCEGVRELMEGESGKIAREKAMEYRKEAVVAVDRGGSSWDALDQLLNELQS